MTFIYIKFRGSVITKHLSGLQIRREKFQEKTETGNNNSNKENHDTVCFLSPSVYVRSKQERQQSILS